MNETISPFSNDDIIFIVEMFYASIIPALSIFILILLILSAIIFNNEQFKANVVYQYIKYNSIIDALVVFSILVCSPVLCGSVCKFSDHQIANYIDILIRSYFIRVVTSVSSMLSVTITVSRYLTLYSIYKLKYQVTAGLLFVIYLISATIYSIPNIFFKENQTEYFEKIKFSHMNNSNRSKEHLTEIGYFVKTIKLGIFTETSSLQHIVPIMQYLSHLIPLVLMILFNSLLINKLKTQIKSVRKTLKPIKKRSFGNIQYSSRMREEITTQLTNETTRNEEIRHEVTFYLENERVKRMGSKLTLMIIYLSIVYIINQIVLTFAYTIYIFTDSKSKRTRVIFLFIHFLIIFYPFLNIIIYYKFNKFFANRFKSFLNTVIVKNIWFCRRR